MPNARDTPAQKIGAGHLAGMGRQGLRELRGLVYPNSNVAQQPDLGIYGNSTPGEIAEARRADEPNPEIERWEGDGGSIRSVLEERLKQAEARDVHGRDSKGLEKNDLDKE